MTSPETISQTAAEWVVRRYSGQWSEAQEREFTAWLEEHPDHPFSSVQTGEVRVRGIELEGHASLTNNLDVVASYTYTDAKNTKSNSDNLDKAPTGIPRNMASL